jgi:hypothetical protein
MGRSSEPASERHFFAKISGMFAALPDAGYGLVEPRRGESESSTARAAVCPDRSAGAAGWPLHRSSPVHAVRRAVTIVQHPDAEVVQAVGVPVIHLTKGASVYPANDARTKSASVTFGSTTSQSRTAVMAPPNRVIADTGAAIAGRGKNLEVPDRAHSHDN